MGFVKGQPKPPGSGRKGKGKSPNKKTVFGQDKILRLLDDYCESGLMDSDFALLQPKERLFLAEKLTQYIVPKRQAVEGDLTVREDKDELVGLLEEMAGDDA